jgi:aspartate aminotransferase
MSMKAFGTTTKQLPIEGGRAKSLNLNVRGLEESATLNIQRRCQELQRRGVHVFNFGLGQSPFPVPMPVVEALRLHAHEKAYLPVRGLASLREAVAAFHRRTDGVEALPESVLVGPGSKELMFLLQVAFYGELLLPSPCWVSYGPQARILGKQIRLLPMRYEDRWHLSGEQLEQFLCAEGDDSRPRILVLNYPGNPEGLTYAAAELAEIADVARRYGVIILSDEIYGQIHHRGEHISIARFYPEGTIISSGLSKWCGAGGWRLGTMTFPPALHWLLDAMACVASETYSSVSAPIQFAAVSAFTGGIQIERYLQHSRRILAGLGERVHAILHAAGIRVHPPEGAFYLLLDFEPFREELRRRGVKDGWTLCERLLVEASVAVLPGAVFERPDNELTTRLAYINFAGGASLAASETVPLDEKLSEEYFEKQCPDTLKGCSRIVEWLRTS